jgi:tRNA uridine 5-carboxymethylaminomethyl modification enzyme
MFKVFFHDPQMTLEDMLKFEKVQEYAESNALDREILEQAEIK